MSVSNQTQATTSEDAQSPRSLAAAISEIDREEDTRDCPHNCHGELTVTGDDSVLCQTCRCTPDGVYLPPEPRGETDNGADPRQCSQYSFFHPSGTPSSVRQPLGSAPTNRLPEQGRERYRNSGRVKLVGGFESAWPDEKVSRSDSLI